MCACDVHMQGQKEEGQLSINAYFIYLFIYWDRISSRTPGWTELTT